MKKILIIATLILFPVNVYAKNITIECNDTVLENTKETECEIIAKNLEFNVTNITGKIIVSDNLKIVSSSYDDAVWKIFDKKFTVEDINLISENKHNGNSFAIAKFKLKAINQKHSNGEIKFIDIELGDENYVGHKLEDKQININLKYDSENNKINNNIIKNIIFITLILSFLVFLGYKYKKNNKNE